MSSPAAGFCWIDLGTPDINTAAGFYRDLFGWTFSEPDPTGYRLASLNGNLVAALGPATDPGQPYWTVYVHTDDIRASIAAVTMAGGTIVAPPTPAGEAGVSAVVRDPTGAPLSFWQPGNHVGVRPSTTPGALASVELATDRAVQTRDFLRKALNWQVNPDGSTITHHNRVVATWRPAPVDGPSPWLVTFAVPDVATARATALNLGASPTNRGTVLFDPTGARFAITATAP
jgi:predicted enzyme related to lactoylglutathione lyase